MPIHVNISAENVTDLLLELTKLAAGKADAIVTPEKLDKALDKAIDEAIPAEKPKRSRQAKVVEPEPAVAPAPAPTPGLDRDALFAEAKSELARFVAANTKDGREKAIEILKNLGVTRLTELDVEGLQKFLVAVKV